MRKLTGAVLSLVLLFAVSISAQNSNTKSNANKNSNKASTNANRKPPFRANAEQIKQAQAILKQKNFYSGDQTGKLDDATRAGLKKYQEAEGLKITGTLNKVTLEKMAIVLTDKQKTM